MAFHFATNAWRLGGIEFAVNDLAHAFRRRTLEINTHEGYIDKIVGDMSNYPQWLLAEVDKFFNFPWITISLLFMVSAYRLWKRNEKKSFQYPIIITVSLFSLWAIFPQLTAIQFDVIVGRGGIFFTSAIKGLILYVAMHTIFKENISYKPLGIAIICALAYISASSVIKLKNFITIESKNHNFKYMQTINEEVFQFIPQKSILATNHIHVYRSYYLHQPHISFLKHDGIKMHFENSFERFIEMSQNSKEELNWYYIDLNKIKTTAPPKNMEVVISNKKYKLWKINRI